MADIEILSCPSDLPPLVGRPLSIISFDEFPDAARREAEEDRSLNLALRRKKVRSEILRLPADPSASVSATLGEYISVFPDRELIILLRRYAENERQQHAVDSFSDHPGTVVIVGSHADHALLRTVAKRHIALAFDVENREMIEVLADLLASGIAQSNLRKESL